MAMFAAALAAGAVAVGAAAGLACSTALAQDGAPTAAGSEGEAPLPSFDDISKGFRKVISTADGQAPMFNVWVRDRDAGLLGEIPADFLEQHFYIVPTVAGGDVEMGVYSIWNSEIGQDMIEAYWKQYDRRLVLIAPNRTFRSSGDAESKASTQRVYTDRVLLSAPIIAAGPDGGFVIDLHQMLLGSADKFFGNFTSGGDMSLARLTSVKAFPYNIEISFEFPRADGQLAVIHYSIGDPPRSEDYQPRQADRRVGFFYTDFTDRAKNDGESQKVRYINRWNLQKRDPDLEMSPPVRPIVYYIEYTTPVRYRRWVRDGILAWNRAFEQVGIINAIEVRQQDARTGAYMDLDPEDIRYSFVRWTNSHMGFAIGPSHAHPDTGEIYEADIVMDEAFISGWANAHLDLELASAAMRGMTPETVDWLDRNPIWDPRYRLTAPSERAAFLDFQRLKIQRGEKSALAAFGMQIPATLRPEVWEPLENKISSNGAICPCMDGLAADVEAMRLALDSGLWQDERAATASAATSLTPTRSGMMKKQDAGSAEAGGSDEDKGGEKKESLLDGLPESFVGPLLKDVIMHEVGHTMGLMHNWKGSAAYTFEQMNSQEWKGHKPILCSVMDYAPTNIIVPGGDLVQGDLANIDIGPYDMWAIRWGYGTQEQADQTLKEVAQADHGFSSEEGDSGPDPTAKSWDLGSDSLDFCAAQMKFVRHVRERIIAKGVKDGKSWQKAREMYNALLYQQMGALSTAADWIGGAYTNKFHKGDPNAPDPVTPVEVERQRRALQFIFDNGFDEKAFDLSPQLLNKLGTDQWWDENGDDPQDWPIHDRVLAVQASALTLIINPTRLQRIMDNESRVGAGKDALTVPEVMNGVMNKVWPDMGGKYDGHYDNLTPFLTTCQRNLQNEHLTRLIDLSKGMSWPNATQNTIASLARQNLRDIQAWIDKVKLDRIDEYSQAHLSDCRERITKALAADYVRQD